MTKATQRPTTQQRYNRQVAADRRAAALQRAEERRLSGQTTEETITALYVTL